MMNFHMAVVTNCQSFAALRNHHLFPGLFTLQVFDFVYMMDFQFHIHRATEFTFLCFQTGIKRRSAFRNHRNHYRLNILTRFALNLVEFREAAHFGTGLCFIGNPPALLSNTVLVVDFVQLSLVLSRQRFQTAILHQVTEIVQTSVITGKKIVIAKPSQFRIKNRHNFQIRVPQ